MTQLFIRDGDGYREAAPNQILDRARALVSRRYRQGTPALENPRRTREFLQLKLGALDYELFAMIALYNRHRVIEFAELFPGTIDGASVHPHEVVKGLLRLNAAAAIFAHNHPSGIAVPSQADELITSRLRDACALVDIRVLDHLIVGDTVVSFAERGLL
ncbi:MAG: JAB domain-containing protein [Dehalococcoidia bacterium]